MVLITGGLLLILNGFGNYVFKGYPIVYLVYMVVAGVVLIAASFLLRKRRIF